MKARKIYIEYLRTPTKRYVQKELSSKAVTVTTIVEV